MKSSLPRSETGPDIVFGKVRVALQDLRVAPTGGAQVHHWFDQDPRVPHDRFSGQSLGGDDDAILPGHSLSPPPGVNTLYAETEAGIR
jgi:hypothetical protein